MRRKLRKLDEILEIPVELGTDNPKLTITGFERLLIENYMGILEYQDYFVRVNMHIGTINIRSAGPWPRGLFPYRPGRGPYRAGCMYWCRRARYAVR